MQKTFKRVLATTLASVMALSAFSISASAVNTDYRADYQSETHTVFKHTEQTLAPGVEYYNNYAYSSDGKQMVYYVTTADVNRDDVVVQVSYKDMQCDTYGMSKLSEQVDAANAKFSDPSNPEFISENYQVVSATNGDGYNMTTGEPGGCLVMNGKIKKEWTKNSSSEMFFAILNDGRAVIADTKAEWDAYKANPGIKEAIDSFGTSAKLVWDGVDTTATASGDYNTDRHSRTMFGVTADGKVVQAVLDGRQEPFSCGGSMHELAQIMIEAGCVRAFNCDGGGSTTFMARTLGDDSAKVVNRPSDGSPRSISNGLIIATTTPPSDKFDRVSMTAADEYITPGTATEMTFAGVSPAGTATDIPAEVTYEATLGSVVDGQFVSNGTAGDAVISAKYEGKTVGTATVHVVVPDSIEFSSDNFTIPYGKSSDLSIVAKYGLNDVKIKASDFTFTIDNPAAGTIDGFTFTAAEESDIASTTITAAYNGTELTASAGLVFGKGSEVIFDFEDGTTNGFGLSYSNYNYYLPNSKVFVANKDNGQVHSGNYALGLNIDYSNSQESGYQMTALYQGKVSGNVTYYPGAIKLGTWLYIPDEYVGLWVRWTVSPITAVNDDGTYTLGSITSNAMDNGAGGTGVVYSFDEPGWHYLTADLSQYKGLGWRDFYYCMQFYISDRDGASYGYYAKNQHNINGDFTVYMDDVTIDYSTVVEDRDAPVFGSVKVSDEGPHSNEAYAFSNGYESDGYSSLGFSADVNEFAATNASGINASSAQAYIDGNPVATSYSTGKIFTNGEYDFAEGQHTVKFVICDNAGNRASATRYFSVTNVDKAESVKVVAHDPSLDRILHGSLYWVDVVAENAEKIDTVTTTLNLDSMSKWELDHMTVADGFEASYEVVDAGDKIVKLTIKNNGSNLAGEQALVSMPIRAWELNNSNKRAALTDKEWTYAQFKASKEFWPVATEVRIQQGEVNYTDGAKDSFTGENVFVWSESWANYANMTATAEGKAYFNAWNGGHTHDAELTVTKEAKAPTCTEDGWTAEYSCATCNSVVTWSKTVPATGHDFELDVDQGKVICKTCGVVDTSFTGLIEKDGKIYFAQLGVLATGWKYVDGKYYYFEEETKAAYSDTTVAINAADELYTFDENGVLTAGSFTEREGHTVYHWAGGRVKRQFFEIDGETYYFDFRGWMVTGFVGIEKGSNAHENNYYVFDENGKQVKQTGLTFACDGTICYLGDDYTAQYVGMVQDGEDYYYINSSLKAVKDCEYLCLKTNGLMPADKYAFDEDGKMIKASVKNGVEEENGTLYYYIDGEKQYNLGLVEIDGDYYYVRSGGQLATGDYLVWSGNGIVPDKTTHHFDADGKMNDPVVEPKNGVEEENGALYLYKDGEKLVNAHLVEFEGDYYYVRSSGQLATGDYLVWSGNGIVPDMTTHHFDADGKMNDPIVEPFSGIKEEDGSLYLYIDDVKQINKGLVEFDGAYYYVRSGGQLATGDYLVWSGNGIVPDKTTHHFELDGKMNDPTVEPFTGIKEEEESLYLYIDDVKQINKGLVEYEGAYYYVRSGGQLATGDYLVWSGNGIVPDMTTHHFEADGKMNDSAE